jgi:serine/threonine protein kinase
VSLYDLFSDGDHWCFTMELVTGKSFAAYIDRDGRSSCRDKLMEHGREDGEEIRRLRNVFGQLAGGVAALHAADKLHRDLKPGNVMVTDEGRVVVLDFGLGAELGPAGFHDTTTDHVFGSISYMSPEQTAGGSVSAASDWYSVGVMLFEALAGRLPFEGTLFDIICAKGTREPDPPCVFRASVPEDLNALCGVAETRSARATARCDDPGPAGWQF